MSEESPSPALSHLTPEQVQTLMYRYYAGEHVTSLLGEFEIQCAPSALCRQFPPEQVGIDCPACAAPLIKRRGSRSSFPQSQRSTVRCSSCMHIEREGCSCPSCRAKRANEAATLRQRQRDSVAEFCAANWHYEITQIEPEHLSAEAAVALLSLIRCGGWMNSATIGSLGASPVPYTPHDTCITEYLLGILINNTLIAPSLDSAPDAFTLVPGRPPHWDWRKVCWSLLLPSAPDFVKRLELLAANKAWPEGWHEGAHGLWKQLAMAECREYCTYAVMTRNLPMPSSTALTTLLDNLLRDHSVSQCYQLIWNAATRAVDYMVRGNLRPQHAANALIGNCQRYADKARAEKWEVKGFKRNFHLPRSQLSYVLHDVVFKHGEVGFCSFIAVT